MCVEGGVVTLELEGRKMLSVVLEVEVCNDCEDGARSARDCVLRLEGRQDGGRGSSVVEGESDCCVPSSVDSSRSGSFEESTSVDIYFACSIHEISIVHTIREFGYCIASKDPKILR